MKKFKYVSVMDCLCYAKDRISFLACMFSAVDPGNFHINDRGIAGLTQTLWSISDILDEAEEFINQAKAKSDLENMKSQKKEAPE